MLINPYSNGQVIKNQTKANTDLSKEVTLKIIEDSKINLNTVSEESLKQSINKVLAQDYGITNSEQILSVENNVINSILGYGILQKYLDDFTVTDIRVTNFDRIFIKKQGQWIKTNDSFESQEDFENYIRFCALKNNSNINYEKPIAIFSDRKNLLRLEAGINPVNICSSNLVIRIHRENINNSLEELYTKTNMISAKQYKILKAIAQDGSNIIICGKGRKW